MILGFGHNLRVKAEERAGAIGGEWEVPPK
jgi:hypothetical protein